MKTRTTLLMFTAVAPNRQLRPPSPWTRRFLVISVAAGLAGLAVSPSVGCDETCDSYPESNTGFGDLALAGASGIENTALGEAALQLQSTGSQNTAVGTDAMAGDVYQLPLIGSYNTAIGARALYSYSSGSNNTATGYEALYYNGAGSYNTADGIYSLANNFNGSNNTATGASALGNISVSSNNTATGAYAIQWGSFGDNNTATGAYAIQWGFAGDNNTATGYAAMQGSSESSNEGSNNTANGAFALFSNTTGSENTAIGVEALSSNTTASNNVAVGSDALAYNTIGSDNMASGVNALFSNVSGSSNTAIGSAALASNTRGSNNIGLGTGAGGALTIGDNNIDIGNTGMAGESAKIRIGTKPTHKNTYIAGIYGVTVPRGLGVIIDSSGHLGTSTSSARFKDNIKPMGKASEVIHALQPVTFHYKKELDPGGTPQFGLVAEEVAKIDPDLVARDEDGKPYTVRYEAVNAMLLNEFLKEHKKVEEQEATIAQLKSADAKQETVIAQQQKNFEATIAQQQKEIETLTSTLQDQASQIQKITARVVTAAGSPPYLVVSD
jgi:hypothetical protein